MNKQTILIIDEARFSRICAAILEFIGYRAKVVTPDEALTRHLRRDQVALVVTSYPFGAHYLGEISRRNVPTIVLSDNLDGDLMRFLGGFSNFYCMIKPLDYNKFRDLVGRVMSGEMQMQGGYNIV